MSSVQTQVVQWLFNGKMFIAVVFHQILSFLIYFIDLDMGDFFLSSHVFEMLCYLQAKRETWRKVTYLVRYFDSIGSIHW